MPRSGHMHGLKRDHLGSGALTHGNMSIGVRTWRHHGTCIKTCARFRAKATVYTKFFTSEPVNAHPSSQNTA